jgi:hypothetical protein
MSQPKAKQCISLVVETTDKNKVVMVEAMDRAMDRMNITHVEVEEKRMIVHGRTFKECFKYLKERDKKVHKASQNMVSVLFNMSVAMCHA